MRIKVILKPQAKVDLVELSDFISQRNLAAAERFLDAVEAALGRLSKMPELGTPCDFQSSSAAGIRVWSISGFGNYLIFYRCQEDTIDIVRVLHGSRDIEVIFGTDNGESKTISP